MFNKNIFLAFLLLLVIQNLSAQYTFIKKWDRRYGGTSDEGLYSVTNTKDKGYILGGFSNSGISGDKSQATHGNSDYWVIKVDSTGNKQWDKRFGGSATDVLFSLQQTTDDGYILGGNSYSNISGDKTESSWGNSDYWVVKIDSTGNKQWDKRFGGTKNDVLATVIQTTDNKYLLGGSSNSGITGNKSQSNWDNTSFTDDYWIVKIDEFGSKEWDKRFGGDREDGFASLSETADKGFLLGGTSSSDSIGDKTQVSRGSGDYWIVKIDSVGNKQWDNRYGVNSGAPFSFLLQSEDKGYILSGIAGGGVNGDKTESGCGSGDFWIVKTDSIGNKLWDRDYGGNSDDYVFRAEQTFDNGYLISGTSTSNLSCNKTEDNVGTTELWVLKIDSIGNKQWDKTIFSDLALNYGIGVQSLNGCFVFGASVSGSATGYQSQSTWNGSSDYWIMKFCMDTVVGIGDVEMDDEGGIQIQVWPNPFSSDLSIALKGGHVSEAEFIITNALGQVIYKREESNLSSNYTKMLDLSYLPGGVYFVEVTTNNGCTVKQVVKQ